MANEFDSQRDEAAGEESVDTLANEQAIQKLEADLHEAGERLLRSQAELENYRKRVRREMDDERRYAALPLMHDLLPVVDNLERALEAAQQTGDGAGLQEGVKMVATQLSRSARATSLPTNRVGRCRLRPASTPSDCSRGK